MAYEKKDLLFFIENDSVIAEIDLTHDRTYAIGRGKNNDIIFSNQTISSAHAELEIVNRVASITDLNSTNGTFVNEQRIESNLSVIINENSRVYFGKNGISSLSFKISEKTIKKSEIEIQANDIIKIGRNKDCDVVLDDLTVSRYHASLQKIDDYTYKLIDLDSTNGTYFKGKKIRTVELKEGDTFLIGKFLLSTNGSFQRLDNRTAVKVEFASKKFKNGNIGLHPISFEIRPKTLTAIMGPSGCGKSTLLKMLNGVSANTAGKISLFDLDLERNFEYIKQQIGYVPQDDIVHMELTVYQSIYYSARIRLENESEEQIRQKIELLLAKLKIEKIRDNLNSEISGGQRKRVCIAIELLTDPMLLLLDEPTSPLDPQSIAEFMEILKSLSVDNTTIVMVTHKPEDLQFMDEVIFLAEGGYFAFKGSVDNYLDFFKVHSTVDVYSLLSGENVNQWKKNDSNVILSQHTEEQSNLNVRKINWFRQVYWLTLRSLKIKTNDKINTTILILQAPLIAFLISLIFKEISLGVLFMVVISSIWFGVNNSAREIVKENSIFIRESLFNVNIGSYLFSKVLTLTLLASIQSVLFILILKLSYNSEKITWGNTLDSISWLFVITMASSLLGLLVSASMKSTDKVMALVPILLIPQIMLAGVITKISSPIVESISYLTFSRWGTEGLARIQGDVSLESKEIIIDTLGQPLKDASGSLQMKTVFIKEDPINLLNDQYHDNFRSVYGEFADHFSLDLIAILFMSILIFVGIFHSLKRKISR